MLHRNCFGRLNKLRIYEYMVRASLLHEPCYARLKIYFGCDLIPIFILSFGNIDRCEYRGNSDPYACGSKMSAWANPTTYVVSKGRPYV